MRTTTAAKLSIVITVLLASHAFAAGKEELRVDGAWWAQSDPSEKVGLLYALEDCLVFDAKPGLWFNGKWADYEKKITDYYNSLPATSDTTVQTVFSYLGKKRPAGDIVRQQERYGDEFWRAHDNHARRAFVEGYLSCRRNQQRGSPEWTKPIGYYVEQLNEIYNVDDRNGEDAPEYTGSVASALEKLSDGRSR